MNTKTSPDPLSLPALRRLVEEATPGLWTADGTEVLCGPRTAFMGGGDAIELEANAALIVAAVNALPELLDRLEALTAELSRLTARVEELEGALKRIEVRAAKQREWLSDNSPFCFVEQKHLDENTPERAYWHYGSMSALSDATQLIRRALTHPAPTPGEEQ